MTKYIKISLAVMLLVFTFSVASYASVDGDLYGDDYTRETNAGHWIFTSFETGKSLESVTIITATPAPLTTVTSGNTYLIAPAATTIVTVTLPAAASQLEYKFVVGNTSGADAASTMVLSPSGTDKIIYGVATAGSSLRSTQATGATIQVHGVSGAWYVSDVVGTWTVE